MTIDEILKEYEQNHLDNIIRSSRRIQKVYADVLQKISVVAGKITFNGKLFKLAEYPQLEKAIKQQLKSLHNEIYSVVTNSIETSWNISNAKNNILVDKRILGRKLPASIKGILYDPNLDVLKRFKTRVEEGLNLSDRIWKAIDPFPRELEQSLGMGIGKGQSAASMARDLQQYLNNPDDLFRRVRGEDGRLYLSSTARNYHPGQGVYRSSFKNALRLSRTETNMAYRTSDWERWQNMPFVIGIEIHLSAQHPRYDICDPLATRYPKDFKWAGWHPQCICYMTPILNSEQAFNKQLDAILAGESPATVKNSGVIKKMPASFNEYVKKNAARIAGWKNKPYWVRDNKAYFDQALKVKKIYGKKLPVDYSKLQIGPYLQRVKRPPFDKVFPELSLEEKASINGYTDTEYYTLNAYLRGLNVSANKAEMLDNYRNLLNNALDSISDKFVGITFRGTYLDHAAQQLYRKALVTGKPIVHDYFTSTTIDEGQLFSGNTMFMILSKRGRYVKALSEHQREEEVLFKAGTKFQVQRMYKEDDKLIIEMEEV